MIELRNDADRKKYIRALWPKLFNESPVEFTEDFKDIGVMNFVYKINFNNRTIYLKQALEKLKKEEGIGEDLKSVPKERIKFERQYIQTIKKHLPLEIHLPEVLNYDPENNVLALSDVQRGGILLETQLLNGNFSPKSAFLLGKFLGIAHRSTFGRRIIIRDTPEEDRRNWDLFLNMRTRGVVQKEGFPDPVRGELENLCEAARHQHTYDVVINLDCCPKNVFERAGSIGVIDFEMASGVGDPAYDLGFLIGHYLIMAIVSRRVTAASQAVEATLMAYKGHIGEMWDGNFEQRLMKYAGAVLLYRLVGSSPARYIGEDVALAIREIGTSLLLSTVATGFGGVYELLQRIP